MALIKYPLWVGDCTRHQPSNINIGEMLLKCCSLVRKAGQTGKMFLKVLCNEW